MLCCLALCADAKKTDGASGSNKKANSKTSISVFTMQQREYPPKSNPAYKWIEKNFGVTFDWDILVGDKDVKIGILINSGDLPDMVEVDSRRFQNAGCLRDLKPLLEKYGPNLMRHYSSIWKKMIDSDSEKDAAGNIVAEHIYSLPSFSAVDGIPSDTYYNVNAWWIQKAVLKEFGYPKIKTVDQYFDLIEKYYQLHPTIDGKNTIPFSLITADWEAFNLWNPPQFLGGNPNEGNGHVVREGGKLIYEDMFTDANAKRWFKLANSYFQRGLIDPESFTDTREQYYSKISEGRVLGMFIQGWEFMGEPEEILWYMGKDERTYAPLPLTFDESIRPHYRDYPLPDLQRGYGITVRCPEDKAIRIIQFRTKCLRKRTRESFTGDLRARTTRLTKTARLREPRARHTGRQSSVRNRKTRSGSTTTVLFFGLTRLPSLRERCRAATRGI